jgi:hypothetical protein
MLAKQLVALLPWMGIMTIAHGQINDLPVYTNGLIYAPATMARLKHTVDSLHLKFKQCPLTTTYYSFGQTVGHFIVLDTGNIPAALQDIKNGISYSAFTSKYPLATIDSNNLVVEENDWNFRKEKTLQYVNITEEKYHDRLWVTKDSIGFTENSSTGIRGKIGRWVFDYDPPDKYSKENIRALYLTTVPVTQSIPETYARDILYADCMVDTNTNLFLEEAKYDRGFDLPDEERKPGKKYIHFQKYIDQHSKNIIDKYRSIGQKGPVWYDLDSIKQAFVRNSLSTRPTFRALLAAAVTESLKENYVYGGLFEYYTELYYSKNDALTMKRRRIVMGACSRDVSPRLHIMDISLLAAEAANWQVFLRAHLDIMNDFAARNFNSNFAERERKTYIREIEELDINVQDLLLGISLQISNAASNHYTGSAGRLGRAFAETRYRAPLEKKLLVMIADERLDHYNRYMLYHLFLNYLYYLPQKEDRTRCLQLLQTAIKNMPPYLLPKLKLASIWENVEAGAGEQ